MRSYDVFDTLIARLCIKGHALFEIIESFYKLPNYKNMRIEYERTHKNFNKVHSMLSAHYNLPDNKTRDIELKMEKIFSIPVVDVLDQVLHNDMFVSDMYLDKNQIMDLIRIHRPTFQNTIYASYGDKLNGSFWKNNVYKITEHYGDNMISDVNNPKKFNISSVYVPNSKLTHIEDRLLHINKFAALSLRATRLSLSSNHITNMLSSIIIPLIIGINTHLYQIHKGRPIVFLSRDGYWFKHFYDIMFPNNNTHYVYFSRTSVNNTPDQIANTLKQIGNDLLLFDLQGSGNTFHKLNDKYLKTLKIEYLIGYLSSNPKHTNAIIHKLVPIRSTIEILLQAPHGSFYKYQEDGSLLFCQPESPIHKFKDYFHALQLFSKYYSILFKYCKTNTLNFTNLLPFIEHLSNVSCESIKTHFKHVNNHSYTDKGHPFKYYSQISQDQHYIENIAKYRPCGTFLEIGGYDGITGSNTYTLEKYLNWNGIIVECNPDLYQLCKKNRSCIIHNDAVFNQDDKILDFTIPEGKDIIGGKYQLGGLTDYIKKESKSAFRNSYATVRNIKVKTITLNTLLKQNQLYSIDYMSIDTEGSELEILKAFDFNTYQIRFITIEHGTVRHYQKQIYDFLTSKGYSLHRNNKWDDEYILNT